MKMNDTQKALGGGLVTSNKVELPFKAGNVWVMNGQANMAAMLKSGSVPPAMYFGGFAANVKNFEETHTELGLTIPTTWQKTVGTSRDGKSFDEYVTRQISFAPITKRASYYDEATNRRSPGKFGNARFHINVLASGYLPTKNAEGHVVFQPWMPLIISAKGAQAFIILDAFRKWEKHSRAARKAMGEMAHNAFILTMGTFGDTRIQKMVGPEGKQSPITPLSLRVPEGEDDLTQDFVAPRYVGDEFVTQMVELLQLSTEWVTDWKADRTESVGKGDEEAAAVPAVQSAEELGW
jgi:hypothetical protein